MKVRTSLGSAISVNKFNAKCKVKPTTFYILTYKKGKCSANCSFCPQARTSTSECDKLSRVNWPIYNLEDFFSDFDKEKFYFLKRICIQCINYKNVERDAKKIIEYLRKRTDLPISLSIQPLSLEEIHKFKLLGLNKICFPLDAATPEIFNLVKGKLVDSRYKFENNFKSLKDAVSIFGKFNVTTHLIIGLGETEEEAIKFLVKMRDEGIYVGLFAFTPIKGTALENLKPPEIKKYRIIQLIHYLIFRNNLTLDNLVFDNHILKTINLEKEEINKIVNMGLPFLTSGCPDCNRPFYNERISGPIYNYPSKELLKKDMEIIKKHIWRFLK